MKRTLLLATTYPYTAGIIALIWIGSALLLRVDDNLSFAMVIVTNVVSTIIIASIGFRK